MQNKPTQKTQCLRIGIVGAGFSGIAFALACQKLKKETQIEVFLFEKYHSFGMGEAYSTPFFYHLLNVRAHDMSVYHDDPDHFVNWLNNQSSAQNYFDSRVSVRQQFMPRRIYGDYLQSLVNEMKHSPAHGVKFHFESNEVIHIDIRDHQATLELADHRKITVDKVVLALGNNPATSFPFPLSMDKERLLNPWDYEAPTRIPKQEAVLIAGTGLSMIDTVLTLHHRGHEGPIYAISRRGLLPLPHTHSHSPYSFAMEELPANLRTLTKYLRAKIASLEAEGGDWRAVVMALRPHLQAIWQQSNLRDKKSFLRHMLPYWNIHRHRVHSDIFELLQHLMQKKRLRIISGKIVSIDRSAVTVRERYQRQTMTLPIQWVVNCMGPALNTKAEHQVLMQSLLSMGHARLDSLQLGLDVSLDGAIKNKAGQVSSVLFTIGPPAKGIFWEITAVPDIRKQCFNLAMHLFYGHETNK